LQSRHASGSQEEDQEENSTPNRISGLRLHRPRRRPASAERRNRGHY